jgi:hypothetical protein
MEEVMDFGMGEKPLAETTLGDLHKMIKDSFDLKVKIDELESLVDVEKTALEKIKFRMSAVLAEHNMKYFKTEFGAITRKAEFSVKVPKLQADREAFFAYLRERELFDQMIAVNSKTLNSYVKEQRDAAIAEGILEFSIPGIEPGIEIYRISMTKK